MDEQKLDDELEPIDSSSVSMQDVSWKNLYVWERQVARDVPGDLC